MIEALRSVFEEGAPLHPIGPSLWSALGPGGSVERYDAIAARYDRLIGSALYQRLAWGNDPENDRAFAREAVASGSGVLFDVGCGSLLFTAAAHVEGRRPTLLFDLSLGMLRRGAERLAQNAGSLPEHVALVQADALALPLRPGSAETLLCPGILHLFADPAQLLSGLARWLAPGGRLYVSSLVTDRGFGRGYLRLLARSGEVRALLSSSALQGLVEDATGLRARVECVGNMAYVRTDPADPRLAATGPNAAMIEHWNDVVGPGWAAEQEALDAHLAPIGELALEHAAPRQGERVLDVGCGCGATCLAIAAKVSPEGHVVGVDLSAPMLARARERAAALGLSNIDFRNADAQTAKLGGPFDLAFSRFGVMFFSDFARAFANLRGALAPGGRLVFVCWRELERNAWMNVPMRAAAAAVEVPPPLAPGQPGPYGLADGDAVRSLLEAAGFEAVQVAPFDLALPIAGGVGVEEAADFCTRMGPVSAALRKAPTAKHAAVRNAVRDAMLPYVQNGHVLLDAAGWKVSARNPR